MARDNVQSDEQLIKQFINGTEQAFEELVQRYYRQVYRFTARFTGQRDLAEDITQETFMKVHQAASGFDLARKFKPWLFAIAANKARDALRAAARTIKTVNTQSSRTDQKTLIDMVAGRYDGPDQRIINEETAERAQKTLRALPEKLREVLILAYYERLQYKEIAEVLAVPLGTVKSRLHKAVISFGEIWKATTDE